MKKIKTFEEQQNYLGVEDYRTEIVKSDGIKKSIFFNVIKSGKISGLTDEEIEEFKKFILSLEKHDAIMILLKFIDNNIKNNSIGSNNKMSLFLSDDRFCELYNYAIESFNKYN